MYARGSMFHFINRIYKAVRLYFLNIFLIQNKKTYLVTYLLCTIVALKTNKKRPAGLTLSLRCASILDTFGLKQTQV